ncbi:hypothetical protein B0H13DRAFT_2430260 [Mycena leptocephala]|nr:hypothetical protein B0H13DRAFT_2430260 [Mycena leptocephala]
METGGGGGWGRSLLPRPLSSWPRPSQTLEGIKEQSPLPTYPTARILPSSRSIPTQPNSPRPVGSGPTPANSILSKLLQSLLRAAKSTHARQLYPLPLHRSPKLRLSCHEIHKSAHVRTCRLEGRWVGSGKKANGGSCKGERLWGEVHVSDALFFIFLPLSEKGKAEMKAKTIQRKDAASSVAAVRGARAWAGVLVARSSRLALPPPHTNRNQASAP